MNIAVETPTNLAETAKSVREVREAKRRERPEAVVNAVAQMYKGDGYGRAYLAKLKRAVGENFASARDVGWLYGLLAAHGVTNEFETETYLLVLSLLASDRDSLLAGGRSPGTAIRENLGTTLLRLWHLTKLPQDTDIDRAKSPAARRLRALLDADYDARSSSSELSFRLRQVIALTISKKVSPDWPQLILDLQDWNWPDKPVQKRWAQMFFAPVTNIETSEPKG